MSVKAVIFERLISKIRKGVSLYHALSTGRLSSSSSCWESWGFVWLFGWLVVFNYSILETLYTEDEELNKH